MTRVAAVLALAMLVLAGCGGGPDTDPAPGSSAGSARSPSSTVDLAKETAGEFLHRWVQTRLTAQRTGEVDALRALSVEGCAPCAADVRSIEEVYDAGGYLRPGWSRVRSLEPLGNGRWRVVVLTGKAETRASTDASVQHTAANAATYLVRLRRVNGVWQVADYVVEHR